MDETGSIQLGIADVSVVIPMYNSEKTIVRTLDGISSQVERSYIKEMVVVNDGSTDASASIVEQYGQTSPIPVLLINQANGGVSKARNAGMSAASGKWIAFCDADDVWLPGKMAIQAEIINAIDVDLLGANWLAKDLVLYGRPITTLRQMTVRDLCMKMLVQTSTIVMRRSIFEEIGGFNESQSYAEDGNYILNVTARYKSYYLPVQVVYYGDGKRGFGVSGLSANMSEMYKGNVANIKEMLDKGYINSLFYAEARVVQLIKYLRRIVIAATSQNDKGYK